MVGDSVVVVALGAICQTTIVEGVGELRIEPDRLAIVGDSVVVVALKGVRGTTIIVGDCILGIELDSLAVLDDGVVVVALSGVRETTGECILRIKPGPLPGISDNAIELALQNVFYILAPGHLRIGGSKATLQLAFADERTCYSKCVPQIRCTAQRSVEKGVA